MSKVADNWHPKWYEMLYEQEGFCKMEDFEVAQSHIEFLIEPEIREAIGLDGRTIDQQVLRLCGAYNELQARLETAERLVLQGGAGHDAIVKKAVELQKQRDALLTVAKKAEYAYNCAISREPTGRPREALTECNILRMQAIAEAEK